MKPDRRTAAGGDIHKIRIDGLTAEGLGRTERDGRELLVYGAYPGEQVEVEIVHRGPRRLVGKLRRILEPVAGRRPSPCRKAAVCQGCPLIELHPESQLAAKKDLVLSALAEHGLHDLHLPDIVPAPRDFGYRTTAKLVIGRNRRGIVIGLYRRGSHDIVDISDCPLHHPLINRIARTVKDEIGRQKLPVWNPKQQRGLMRYLLVRVSPANRKALVTLVTDRRDFKRINPLVSWLRRRVPEVVAVHQNVNAGTGNVILGRETLRMAGARDLLDRLGDFSVHIGPTSFLQVNHDQAVRMYRQIADWLTPRPGEQALDLYCGIGGIAMHLAARGFSVTGVEVVPEAVGYAGRNAERNRLTHCRFLAGAAEKLLPHLLAQLPAGSPVTVNPPRSGCDPEVLDMLAGFRPRALVYMSCNPRTLARDLALLRQKGFRIDHLLAYDMFPQTAHVESLALLMPEPGGRRK
ncbi:23S rRNA m(5)U-1939 methyltransferase [Geothermobacter ehrlichii]|uniref:23S rRNA m(5)U-1939 methyltransferase n=1 Tax=Geothermobacter ehrlichii TaxID=213224 RepID=A0A5D3WH43_9BACT|nr:23S rRNA (uracil(1939)-C(5))-methyltransferase RlmD [Geothermobacter ehrlichii]TYO96114.1 23S rRNA m(5)U-1939 methyltransferase [Geothermobacter ehrlichii]